MGGRDSYKLGGELHTCGRYVVPAATAGVEGKSDPEQGGVGKQFTVARLGVFSFGELRRAHAGRRVEAHRSASPSATHSKNRSCAFSARLLQVAFEPPFA
jgi:hypothetical protein